MALGLAQNVDTADEAADQAETLGIGGGIAVLVVLFLAYLAGGYVAGRMARFDGARQGLAVWLVGLLVVLLLAAAGGILGAQYNVLQQLNLPRIPIDEGTATTAGHHHAGRDPAGHAARRRPRRQARRALPPQGRPRRLRRLIPAGPSRPRTASAVRGRVACRAGV